MLKNLSLHLDYLNIYNYYRTLIVKAVGSYFIFIHSMTKRLVDTNVRNKFPFIFRAINIRMNSLEIFKLETSHNKIVVI